MKKLLLIILGLFFSSCGDSLDSIWSDRTEALEKLAIILESVKDEESAEKAIKDLDALKLDFDNIYSRKKNFFKKNAPPHMAEKSWADEWESKTNKVKNEYMERWYRSSQKFQDIASNLPIEVLQKIKELVSGNNEWFVRKP